MRSDVVRSRCWRSRAAAAIAAAGCSSCGGSNSTATCGCSSCATDGVPTTGTRAMTEDVLTRQRECVEAGHDVEELDPLSKKSSVSRLIPRLHVIPSLLKTPIRIGVFSIEPHVNLRLLRILQSL